MSSFVSLRLHLASVSTTIIMIALSPSVKAANELYETATAGTTVTFSASADGNPAPTFKWLKDGVVIPGATNVTIVIPNVTTANNGVYNAVASNSAGWALSNDLILTVATSPITEKPSLPYFTVQPYPTASAPASSSLTLSATAVGYPTPAYYWQKNGTALPGATNSLLTFSSLTTNDSGTYTVIAMNAAGSTTSANSVLTVQAPQPTATAPVITAQPVGQTVPLKGTAIFKVAASGTPAPTFQWQLNGAPINGATSASYTIPVVTSADAGIYTVIATNSAGSSTSQKAMLTVK
jgi:hypothetical protein